MSGTSTSERMSEGNSTTLGVNLLGIELQDVHAVQSLTGEGFVEFIDIDIGGLETSLLEGLGDSESGADTHDLRGDTSDGVGDPSGDDGKTELFSGGSSGQEDGSSTIGDLGGVTGSGDTVLLESGLELLEGFESGFLSDTVILVDKDFFSDFFVTLLLLDGGLDGDDFVLEEALSLSFVGSSLGFSGESVLDFSADVVLFGNIFRGLSHTHKAVSGLFILKYFFGDQIGLGSGALHVILGHLFNTTGNTDIEDTSSNLGGDLSNGFEARRAESVDGVNGGSIGKAAQELTDSGGVQTSTGLGDVTNADILDFLRVDLGLFDDSLEDVGNEGFGRGILKTTLVGFSKRGSEGSADDDIISGFGLRGSSLVDREVVGDGSESC